jgi:hypothetical protein
MGMMGLVGFPKEGHPSKAAAKKTFPGYFVM